MEELDALSILQGLQSQQAEIIQLLRTDVANNLGKALQNAFAQAIPKGKKNAGLSENKKIDIAISTMSALIKYMGVESTKTSSAINALKKELKDLVASFPQTKLNEASLTAIITRRMSEWTANGQRNVLDYNTSVRAQKNPFTQKAKIQLSDDSLKNAADLITQKLINFYKQQNSPDNTNRRNRTFIGQLKDALGQSKEIHDGFKDLFILGALYLGSKLGPMLGPIIGTALIAFAPVLAGKLAALMGVVIRNAFKWGFILLSKLFTTFIKWAAGTKAGQFVIGGVKAAGAAIAANPVVKGITTAFQTAKTKLGFAPKGAGAAGGAAAKGAAAGAMAGAPPGWTKTPGGILVPSSATKPAATASTGLWSKFVNGLSRVFAPIGKVFSTVGKFLSPVFKLLSPLFKILGTVFKFLSPLLKVALGFFGGPIVAAIGAILIIKDIFNVINWIKEHWPRWLVGEDKDKSEANLKGKDGSEEVKHYVGSRGNIGNWNDAHSARLLLNPDGSVQNFGIMSTERAYAEMKNYQKKDPDQFNKFFRTYKKGDTYNGEKIENLIDFSQFKTDLSNATKDHKATEVILGKDVLDNFLKMRKLLADKGYNVSDLQITSGIGTYGNRSTLEKSGHKLTGTLSSHNNPYGTAFDIGGQLTKNGKVISDLGLENLLQPNFKDFKIKAEGDHVDVKWKKVPEPTVQASDSAKDIKVAEKKKEKPKDEDKPKVTEKKEEKPAIVTPITERMKFPEVYNDTSWSIPGNKELSRVLMEGNRLSLFSADSAYGFS